MLENEIKFLDLQLFNDDGATDDSDTSDNTDDTADTGEQYGLDEDGNLVIFEDDGSDDEDKDGSDDSDDDDETNQDDDDTDGNVDSKENKPATDSKYKVKVDGEELEVPLEELLNGYMRQSDYTRKTQALAQERNRIKEAIEQPDDSQAQTQTNANSTKNFYESITNYAKEAISQELSEDFDEFNPVHIAALAVQVNQLTKSMQEQQVKQSAVANFEAEARGKEPENYDAIYEFAKDKVDDLPYRKRVALEQAFSHGDVTVMKTFFEDMRKDFYNSKGLTIPGEETKPQPKKIKKTIDPPIVENGGSGNENTKPKQRNASALGKMSTDQQANWLIENGII